MNAGVKRIILSVVAGVITAISVLPAHAGICLDHSYTTQAVGAGFDAENGAKQRWVDAVKADAGRHWAGLNNAKTPNLSCVIKNRSTGEKICTFTATPCQGSLSNAQIDGLPHFRSQ